MRLAPVEIARRRIIEHFECRRMMGRWEAKITCTGTTFEVAFDDVLDLVQAVELIMLKLTGKLLREKFRPEVKNRAALRITKLEGGGAGLYTGSDAPLPEFQACDVTKLLVPTSYLRIEIEGSVWENWFGRLDELVKCLYIVVREAQGDPYQAKPMVSVRAPKRTVFVGQPGHG